jgi:hypothetical protein
MIKSLTKEMKDSHLQAIAKTKAHLKKHTKKSHLPPIGLHINNIMKNHLSLRFVKVERNNVRFS